VLDIDTKRRIDTARDILVGKVPDPKSQVEQITIALIYKFMDDMDAESEELGGKRKFFTGDYARYGWARLMAPALGGHEMLGLYGEGIAKMPENPGIPPLFRDIFKNAYQHLSATKKEYVLSKQVLRSGTSIGANVEEAIGGQSRADFVSKLARHFFHHRGRDVLRRGEQELGRREAEETRNNLAQFRGDSLRP